MDPRAITDVDTVGAWLGPGFAAELVEACYVAAESYVGARVRWPEDAEVAPDALVQAVCFQTARYLARRSSPDGLVGMGELGSARIPVSDRDVQSLMDPWRVVVVA